MAGGSRQPGRTVATKVLSVLAAFDADHHDLSLTDLAERAGLPLPTAHRLVAELTAWGALSRQPSGRYAVGRRLWDVGLLAPERSDLRALASPFLHDLYAATTATVQLAVRDGPRVLYLDRLSGRVSVPVVSQVRSRLPLHATGVGKVLLAAAPDDVVARVLADLSRHTPYTVTAPGRLLEQLGRARVDGYATTVEEMSLGACSVAVPVRAGSGGPVVAAVGVVVPDLRRSRPRLVAALKVTAQGIGRSLGARATASGS